MASPLLPASQGIRCVDGGSTNPAMVSGVCEFSGSGNPTGVITPNQVGDRYTDNTNGFYWIASGTSSSSWALINNGSPIVMTANVTVTLAQINANPVTIVPAISGHTLTPIYWKIIIAGTLGGSGTFTLQDTNSSPVNIMSATYAAQGNFLAMGTGFTFYSSEGATLSGVTYGAGMCAALTTGQGIQVTKMASLTTITGYQVIVEYIVK